MALHCLQTYVAGLCRRSPRLAARIKGECPRIVCVVVVRLNASSGVEVAKIQHREKPSSQKRHECGVRRRRGQLWLKLGRHVGVVAGQRCGLQHACPSRLASSCTSTANPILAL